VNSQRVTAAFKEWAIIVDALGRGEQIFILRKGGIHEGRGGFRMEHQQFALFPTLFHQQRESVIPPAQARFDEISQFFAPPEILRVEYWAEVVEHHRLDNFEVVQSLRGQHIWREDVLSDRFEWGREQSIYAILVRVYLQPMKLELPMIAAYGGCKSWITLAHSINTVGSEPVLADAAFEQKRSAFRQAFSGKVDGTMLI
jgi:hypothetical protein